MKFLFVRSVLVAGLLASHALAGEYVVTVDYIRRTEDENGKCTHESVVSVAALARLQQRFLARAGIGDETIELKGMLSRHGNDGMRVSVRPEWIRTYPDGGGRTSATTDIDIKTDFDRESMQPARADKEGKPAITGDRLRRLEPREAGVQVWFRRVGDTLVFGGIVSNRVDGDKRERLWEYWCVRVKEARTETD